MCRATQLLLSETLDGELGFVRQWRLARHLRGCERCRERLSELKAGEALVHLTRDWTAAGREVPRGLPGRLQVELGIGPVSRPSPPSRRAIRIRRAAAVAAVVFVVIGVGFAVYRPTREAGALLALGRDNQAKASALLEKARAVEMRILWLRMEMIADDLDAERKAALEEQLASLSELVVAIKADARRYLRTQAAVVSAASAERGE